MFVFETMPFSILPQYFVVAIFVFGTRLKYIGKIFKLLCMVRKKTTTAKEKK